VVEVRSVNHRFLSLRNDLPDGFARFESDVEHLVREKVSRGSVTSTVTLQRTSPASGHLPSLEGLQSMHRRLVEMKASLGQEGPVPFEVLLSLPTVWSNSQSNVGAEQLWPKIRVLLRDAVAELDQARAREGRLIQLELEKRVKKIEGVLAKIGKLSPRVLKEYRRRLQERVESCIRELKAEVAPVDLAREFAVFADRCDISEEANRLRVHVDKVKSLVHSGDPAGRKLDFLIQEMGREANTLAAKANDAEISALAVEVKGEIERIKEQSENVE
jgi:uncharacterized protein (TIGR00255 family)